MGLGIDSDVVEPHRANQELLTRAGVLEDLLAVLQKQLNPGSPSAVVLHTRAFELLRRLAMKFNPVQKRMFENIDLLLSLPRLLPGSSPSGPAFCALKRARASAITEIFTSGKV